jgi:hypothetical protein
MILSMSVISLKEVLLIFKKISVQSCIDFGQVRAICLKGRESGEKPLSPACGVVRSEMARWHQLSQ